MADDTTTAAAAAAPSDLSTSRSTKEHEDEVEEQDEDEGEDDESGAGGVAGKSGGGKKKRKKRKKKKNAAAARTITVPAFQANIRIGPAPPPPSKKKGSSGSSGPPPLGPSEAPMGRAGLAARALEEGELVFEEAPVALVVFQAQAKPRCGYCGRDRPPGSGGGGDGVVPAPCCDSCGKSQLAAAYRLAEGALALVEDVAKESDCEAQLLTLVLLLACLKHLAMAEEGQEEGTAAWCAGWDGVAALEDHRGRMAPEFVAAVEGALSKLWPHLPVEVRATVGPAEGEGVRLACVVNVNSHGCTAPETTNSTIGVGLFPLLAMLNHSCAPNCAFVFLEGAVRVRALRPIAAGEELTVTYLNLLLPRRDRRQILLETKHFLCRCPRCLQPPPSEALLGGVCCAKCGERGLLLAPGEDDDDDVATGLEGLTLKEGERKVKDGGKGYEGSTLKEGEKKGEDQWRCSLCGAAFVEKEVLGYLDTVEASKLQGQIMYRGKAFPQAKAHFDATLALHAATPTGGASAASSSSSAGVKRVTTNSKLRVHPSNHLLVEMLPFLVNACNQLKDYGAASAHLRRMLAVLSEAFPANYPELGDYHHALGVSIFNHLQPRMAAGGALPRNTLQELRASFEQALKIRRTALGEGHPLTRESREMVEATTG